MTFLASMRSRVETVVLVLTPLFISFYTCFIFPNSTSVPCILSLNFHFPIISHLLPPTEGDWRGYRRRMGGWETSGESEMGGIVKSHFLSILPLFTKPCPYVQDPCLPSRASDLPIPHSALDLTPFLIQILTTHEKLWPKTLFELKVIGNEG